MGGFFSAESAKTGLIERELFEAFQDQSNQIKILLLGAGNAGKSTILKQFKVLHTEEKLGDMTRYKSTISSNIFNGITQIIEIIPSLPDLHGVLSKEATDFMENLKKELAEQPQNAERFLWITPAWSTKRVIDILQDIYQEKVIQEVVTDRLADIHRLEIPIRYFMHPDNFARIREEEYIPSMQDYLHCRLRTSGVVSIQFDLDKHACTLIDVGGQRSERKKWISHFDNVTAVMFLASLDDYDKLLLEDEETNRMHETLSVFTDIVKSPFFSKINIILFLNKKDLFAEKMDPTSASPGLEVCFPEFDGQKGYAAGVEYITQKFRDIFDTSRESTSSSRLYVYETMATNTENVSTVINMCKEILLREKLQGAGLI